MMIRSMTIHTRKWMVTISNSIRRKVTRVIFLVIDLPIVADDKIIMRYD